MHATLLRLRCAPGQATEVARLISAEYLPRIAEVEGVLSYTLVHSGQDEVASIGVFTSQAGAMRASELAQSWVRERLADSGCRAGGGDRRRGAAELGVPLLTALAGPGRPGWLRRRDQVRRRSAAHRVSWCRVESCSLRSTEDT